VIAGDRSQAGAYSSLSLFTTWLNGGDSYQIGREIVCGKRLNIHFGQTDERTAEVWFRITAAVDNHADCGNGSAVGANDVDCFLHASAARHDIFDHDEFFVGRNLETAAQGELAIFFFNKDVAFTQRPPDFLANNNSAQSRGDDCIAIKLAQFVGKLSAHLRSDVGMLQEDRTLEILAAMQAGAQNEVAIEKRAGLTEQPEEIVFHRRTTGRRDARRPHRQDARATLSTGCVIRRLLGRSAFICRGNHFDFQLRSLR